MQRLGICASLISRLPASQQGQGRLLSSCAAEPSLVQHKKDLQELNCFYPEIVKSIKEITKLIDVPCEREWVLKVVDYNSSRVHWPGALSTYNTMRVLAPDCSSADLRKAKYLAWAVEMYHACYLVIDDITDDGYQRWGKSSWWRLPEVGLNAVNDASLLEHIGYQILKQEFKDNPNYVDMMDLMQQATMVSSAGRNYDEHVANRQRFDEISPKMYSDLVFLKNTYNAFFCPALVGLLASGRGKDSRTREAVRDMAHDLGLMLQFQDDYEDCFTEDEEDPRLDIRTGRCCWPIVAAKERANDKQMKILRDNYGKAEQRNVDAVMNIFNDLRIAEVFQNEQEANFQRIQEKIERNADIVPPAIMNYGFVTMKYYRSILRE